MVAVAHARVALSFDGGPRWPVKRLVFEGSSAYSSLAAGCALDIRRYPRQREAGRNGFTGAHDHPSRLESQGALVENESGGKRGASLHRVVVPPDLGESCEILHDRQQSRNEIGRETPV